MIGGHELNEALVSQRVVLAEAPAGTAAEHLLAEAGFDPGGALDVASRYGMSEERTLAMAAAVARGFVVGLATARCLARDAENGSNGVERGVS